MRQLLPHGHDDVDPLTAYLAVDRPSPADRPWVTVGMVSSLDGATAVDGRSGPLGGPADRLVFRAVRAIADVILVAAGTARTERYGPVRLSDEARAARLAAGRSELPRLAVVTASLDLDLEHLAGGGPTPIVLTTDDVDPDRRAAAEAVADVHLAGHGQVDVRRAMAALAADGVRVVVGEGGPSLNAALVDADVVDEWCVTLAPAVAGGDSPRLVAGAAPLATPRPLRLDQLLSEDGVLFGRWVRADR